MQTLWGAKHAARLAAELEGDWTLLKLNAALRELRKSRAMTQIELSARSEFSPSTISDLETGRTDAPWSTVRRIFFALDCVPLVLPRPLNEWPRRHAQWRSPGIPTRGEA